MNIFFLHYNVKKCARYHVDKHVVKMILETCQLLCTAIWLTGGEAPYKATHKNHPSAIWARDSKANWLWLHSLGMALCEEYTYRYGKVHKSQQVLKSIECPNLPEKEFTEPTQAMPDKYKHKDSIVAYRRYYYYDKAHIHSWKKRKVPSWIARKNKKFYKE